ncbi:unnamed protein product [Chondrus crispus]|uniref:Uncharacterized protein n=1 Tax=Chondrus crispus TaxID=2769 RepID=S0F2Y4_CHOCR|nr:unnamed protein product [Chondrus crispus]CDF77521.1 unnamed protein product [Chondrus crispus]|eukprot:XP_005717305.1 unnamed protein product [Chondrus crispus]
MFSGSKLRKRDRRMLMSFATSCTCTSPPSPCRATERRCRLTNFSTSTRCCELVKRGAIFTCHLRLEHLFLNHEGPRL